MPLLRECFVKDGTRHSVLKNPQRPSTDLAGCYKHINHHPPLLLGIEKSIMPFKSVKQQAPSQLLFDSTLENFIHTFSATVYDEMHNHSPKKAQAAQNALRSILPHVYDTIAGRKSYSTVM